MNDVEWILNTLLVSKFSFMQQFQIDFIWGRVHIFCTCIKQSSLQSCTLSISHNLQWFLGHSNADRSCFHLYYICLHQWGNKVLQLVPIVWQLYWILSVTNGTCTISSHVNILPVTLLYKRVHATTLFGIVIGCDFTSGQNAPVYVVHYNNYNTYLKKVSTNPIRAATTHFTQPPYFFCAFWWRRIFADAIEVYSGRFSPEISLHHIHI